MQYPKLLPLLAVLAAIPVHSARIYFEDASTDFDFDGMPDISKPDDPLEFRVFVDTDDLPGRLDVLDYEVAWQHGELTLIGGFIDPDGHFGLDLPAAPVKGAKFTTVNMVHHMGTIPKDKKGRLVDRFLFTPHDLVDDAEFDFKITLLSAQAFNDATGMFDDVKTDFVPQVQEVEVQPSPEPAVLGTTLIGLGLLISARRRPRSGRAKLSAN